MKQAFLSPEEIAGLQEEEARSSKPQKRTPEQIEAIYTNGVNILVSASAGSGKTFVMVERILDKLKRGVSVDQLFISTFTVKAAGELKERIEKKVLEALGETQDASLRQHLSAQMSKLDQADIGTMDAFTQKLVTTYGYRLGISPQFRILQDKNEQDLLKGEVFDDLFADYLASADREVFLAIVKNFTGGGKDNKAFREMVYQIHSFSQSTSHPQNWLKEHFLRAHQRWTSMEEVPPEMWDNLKRALLQASDDLEEVTYLPDYKRETAKGSPTAALKKHEHIIQTLREAVPTFETTALTPWLEEIKACLPSGSDVTVAGVKYPIFKSVKAQLREMQHLELVLAYQGQALPLLQELQAFLLDFSAQYLQRKMQENSYEFSDISHFAIQILEEYPAIRQLYQDKYQEVMVDEYQDNNHSQEKMLDLLSNGHNRFMVGDVKQSIYRFRQADPQIFQQKFERYQQDSMAGKLILLRKNFRSQVEVLEATNAIFTRLMDKQVGQITYNAQHQLVAGSPKQSILQPSNEMEYLIYDTDVKDEEASQMSLGEVEVVAKEIIRLHKEEEVPFSDITLLVPSRTRNEGILTTFEKHGIPLVSDGGEASYLKSLEVMRVLDTLRTVHNPLQDYALVGLLKSPMFRFQEDDLLRISLQQKTGSFYEKLRLASEKKGEHPDLLTAELLQKIDDFLIYLRSWRLFSQSHSIYDLIWKIFNEKFYYDYVGALPNGEKRQANLYALGLRANQFEKTGFKGLSRFIRMIDKILASQNDLANVEVSLPGNAVQLMTIHKSKGLEFPYVFLLNMDKAFNAMESKAPFILSRENGIGIQYVADLKEQFETALPHVRVKMNTLPYQINQRELKIANLSEQMRLLYVAMTRAEKKLYLVGKGSQEKLSQRYDGKKEQGLLLASSRESMTSFQDWVLAIEEAFQGEALYFKKRFIGDDELTPEKIGELPMPSAVSQIKVQDQRQSEDIRQALDQLAAVEALNAQYQAAIDLPSVRTPSQIKQFYEPVLADEGMEIMEKRPTTLSFSLPDFSEKPAVTGAQIGSAVHELMQRLPLDQRVTKELIQDSIDQVKASPEVKEKIDSDKILSFFQTELGQEILANTDRLRREAPFAGLVTDEASGESFVLRGIVDGFIRYEDHILLFDYKTDRYSHPEELQQRYRQQMSLYAQTLKKAYGVSRVESYLILLGGETIQVVSI